MNDMAAIKARREAAKADCDGLTIKPNQYRRTVVDSDGLWVADCYSPEIAVHIAAAPADIDTLLAEVERLTGERDALQKLAGKMESDRDKARRERDSYMRAIAGAREIAAALTAERDAAEAALALTTGSTPGKGTGVWVPLDKWTEIQTRLHAYQVYDELLAAEAMVALLQAKLAALQPAASVVSGWVSDGTNPPTTLTVSGTGDSSVSSDTVVGGTITGGVGLVWTDTNGRLCFGDKATVS